MFNTELCSLIYIFAWDGRGVTRRRVLVEVWWKRGAGSRACAPFPPHLYQNPPPRNTATVPREYIDEAAQFGVEHWVLAIANYARLRNRHRRSEADPNDEGRRTNEESKPST